MELQLQNQIKIKIYNVVLNYIQNHSWTNYNGFAEDFTDELIEQFQKGNFDLDTALIKTKGSFLQLNKIKKEQFLNADFKNSMIKAWHKAIKYQIPVCRFTDIFPELQKISDDDVKEVAIKIDIAESKIQEALRNALREKRATPITGRGKDSVLEIADLEHFELKINGTDYGFSVVVKGYRSISGKLKLKDIMHQIHKAYHTHPDYILLMSAREPVDGVVTEMKTYGRDVGNPYLVIFVPPLDLAKFLRWRKLI